MDIESLTKKEKYDLAKNPHTDPEILLDLFRDNVVGHIAIQNPNIDPIAFDEVEEGDYLYVVKNPNLPSSFIDKHFTNYRINSDEDVKLLNIIIAHPNTPSKIVRELSQDYFFYEGAIKALLMGRRDIPLSFLRNIDDVLKRKILEDEHIPEDFKKLIIFETSSNWKKLQILNDPNTTEKDLYNYYAADRTFSKDLHIFAQAQTATVGFITYIFNDPVFLEDEANLTILAKANSISYEIAKNIIDRVSPLSSTYYYLLTNPATPDDFLEDVYRDKPESWMTLIKNEKFKKKHPELILKAEQYEYDRNKNIALEDTDRLNSRINFRETYHKPIKQNPNLDLELLQRLKSYLK